MSNVAPLFPVPANTNTKSVEENVQSLNTVCHVVEVKAPYALVHASPMGVARIATELGLEVYPSKRGGEYYAVRVAAKSAAPVRPVAAVPASIAPVRPAPAPQAAPAARDGVTRLEIKGTDYVVRETPSKRRIDVRRWEVRKVGDELGKPYVVTFQSHDGCDAQCGCPDWIYRRRQCKHITAIQAAFGKRSATQVA